MAFHHNSVEFAVHLGDRAPSSGMAWASLVATFTVGKMIYSFLNANTLFLNFQLCCLLAVYSEKEFRENLAWQSSLDFGGFKIYLFKIVFWNNNDQILDTLKIYLPSF